MASARCCEMRRRLLLLSSSIFLVTWAAMASIMRRDNQDNTNLSLASLLSPRETSQDKTSWSSDLSIVQLKGNIEQLRESKENIFHDMEENEVVGRRISLKLKHVAEKEETKNHVEELDRAWRTLRAITKKLENLEFMLGSMSIKPDDIQTRGVIRKREYLINNLHRALNNGWKKKFLTVSSTMRKYLDLADVANYENYVKIKMKLILRLMDIEKKIQYEINRFNVVNSSLLK